jgi:hypothetical protein
MIRCLNSKFFAIISLALLLFLAFASNASALRVSGVILQATPDPGEHVSLVMEVGLGENDTPANVIIDVMDWLQTPEGDNLDVESYPNPYSAKNMLEVTPSRLHLEPGKSERVNVVADIPADASPGGRYAILRVHAAPDIAQSAGAISNEVAIKALLALNITGPGIQKTGEIASLNVEKPLAVNQCNVSLLFNNTGNIHYKILTEASLKDKDGNVLASATIPPFSSVLPGASRLQQLSLLSARPLKSESYVVEVNVSLEDGGLLATRSIPISIGS